MIMVMNGKGTYFAATILATVGVVALLLPDTSTWTSPSGVTKDLIGAFCLALALSTFAIRRSIFSLSQKVEEVERKVDQLLARPSRG